MTTAIVIPVYNHQRHIAEIARRAGMFGEVIVVDDGSTDGTFEAVRSVSTITLIRHPQNQGKGAALLSGFAAAFDLGCDRAVSIDGDGQHLPEDIALLLAASASGRELVVGSRRGMEDGRQVPWTSRSGRSFSNFWVRSCGGPKLADSQSGFRLYPLPETLELGVRARRYQFEVEVLVRAHRRGLAIREVPVRVVYDVEGGRVSHFRPWLDFMRNSKTFSRLFILNIVSKTFRR